MKLTFLGVGEAFDPHLGNTSVLITGPANILVDCGYTVPAALLSRQSDVEFLDALYLTHGHADHFFGVAPLLATLWSAGRKRPLAIIGQPGTRERFEALCELGYPGLRGKFSYQIEFVETTTPVSLFNATFSFARTDHPLSNYAVVIDDGSVRVGVSGDGKATTESRELFSGCHALVHESFLLDESIHGHTSAAEVLDVASKMPELRLLCLVHCKAAARATIQDRMAASTGAHSFRIVVPEPGDCLLVGE